MTWVPTASHRSLVEREERQPSQDFCHGSTERANFTTTKTQLSLESSNLEMLPSN